MKNPLWRHRCENISLRAIFSVGWCRRDFLPFYIVKQSDDFQYTLLRILCSQFSSYFLLLSLDFTSNSQCSFIEFLQAFNFTRSCILSLSLYACLFSSTIPNITAANKATKKRFTRQNGIFWLAKVCEKALLRDTLYYLGELRILHTISSNISILFSMCFSVSLSIPAQNRILFPNRTR